MKIWFVVVQILLRVKISHLNAIELRTNEMFMALDLHKRGPELYVIIKFKTFTIYYFFRCREIYDHHHLYGKYFHRWKRRCIKLQKLQFYNVLSPLHNFYTVWKRDPCQQHIWMRDWIRDHCHVTLYYYITTRGRLYITVKNNYSTKEKIAAGLLHLLMSLENIILRLIYCNHLNLN